MATHGAALSFETVRSCRELHPAVRRHPAEDTLLRVIDGALRLTFTGAEERLLRTGDEAIVPAGVEHRLSGLGGDARVLAGYRAAL